ncbi:MAG: aldo/keto reductase [Myxococcota bacterium]
MPSKHTIQTQTVALNNGIQIPQVGLGVYRAGHGGQTEAAVYRALEVGYRHVDTAHIYRNEAEVGSAIRRWCTETGEPQSSVFVTTKLWNDHHGYDATLQAFEQSLSTLGLETIDLYLIHWPVSELRVESWRAMERLLQEGRCRSIGVSNFTVRHLEELLERTGVIPAINQIEVHPFLQQRATRAFCHQQGIIIEAYSPLTKGRHLDDARLKAVAAEVERSTAQVLIRWSIQHGMITLPKSSHPGRIAENAGVFDMELNADQMARLDALDEGRRTAWDPTSVP